MKYPSLDHGTIKENTLSAVTAQLLRLVSDEYPYDTDDGTPDGNQRLLIVNGPFDGGSIYGTDGILDNLATDDSLAYSETPFGVIAAGMRYGEDADQNDALGDTSLDMSDFRRWRDWLLQAQGGANLNGSPTRLKRDMDGGGPTVFPRWGDFNGDGQISENDAFQVPFIPSSGDGSPTTEPLTDLGVMMRIAEKKNLWADVNYDLVELPSLVESGDIEVFIRDLYTLPEATAVSSYIVNLTTGGTLVGQQLHTPAEPRRVYTLPSGEYLVLIYVDGVDGHIVLKMQKRFTVTVGSDHIWGPTANLIADVKPSYMGLDEDCAPLQGTYTVDIKGVFDGANPNFPISDSNVGFELNDELRTLTLLEREKLGNEPLEIYGSIFPSCNLSEGSHDLRLNYNYFEAPDGNGFAVDFGGTFDNIDNRFPGRVWNSTDLSPFPECPAFSTTIQVDGNGDATQNLFAVPGTADDGFIRSGYLYDFRYYADGLVEQNTMYITPYEQGSVVTDKIMYRGETAWWFNYIEIVSCSAAGRQNDLRVQAQNPDILNVQPVTSFENRAYERTKPFKEEAW